MAGLHPWADQAEVKQDTQAANRPQGEKRKRSRCGDDQTGHQSPPRGPGVVAQSTPAPLMNPIQTIPQPVLSSPPTGPLPPFTQTALPAPGGRSTTYWSEPASQPRTIITSPAQSLALATSSAPAILSASGQLYVSPIVSPIGVGNTHELPLVDPASVSPIITLVESAPPPLVAASQTSSAKTPSASSIVVATPCSGLTAANLPHSNACPQVATQVLDDEGQEVYGSADGRQTMITKGIVPAVVARRLVT